MSSLPGPTTTCPRGHVIATTDVTSRDGLLVCPVCDRADWSAGGGGGGGAGGGAPVVAAAARGDGLDLWRRPGSAPLPTRSAPVPEPRTTRPLPVEAPAAAPPLVEDEVPAGVIAVPLPAAPAPAVGAERPASELLRAPLALIAMSVVVTLASSCFFVAEAIDLSDAGDVGGAAHLTGTILAAAGNLVLALAVAWIVVLLGRRSRGS